MNELERSENDGDCDGPRIETRSSVVPVSTWRSLEELQRSAHFEEVLRREFPEGATIGPDDLGRRRFLQLMGASLALAGASGCVVQPEETIVPYVRAPEQIVPGRPLYFATASVLGGFGIGVLVESHMGRPTKVEGNPTHPASLGATDVFAQASVLTLYDPDRSQVIKFNGRVSTWDQFLVMLIDLRKQLLRNRGAGLRVLTGTITSPTESRLLARLLEMFDEAKWHVHDPVGYESAQAGARLAFGTEVAPVHHIDRADLIVALDADFLGWGPAKLREAQAFAARREPGAEPNRLYVFEPWPTITGAAADHRWPLRDSEIAALALTIARAVGVADLPTEPTFEAAWLQPVLDDLLSKKGRSIVLAGESQPPAVHALVHAINGALLNAGRTVTYHEPVIAAPPEGRGGSLVELVADIRSGNVETLILLGANPAYDAPADLGFSDLLLRVPTRIQLGLYEDETAERCTWHIPQAHFLECWGDVRAFDGTATIMQPLIAPLYNGRTAAELLAALNEGVPPSTRLLVQETWRGARASAAEELDEFWNRSLRDGFVADTGSRERDVSIRSLASISWPSSAQPSGTFELLFRPDPTIWDGSFSNNAWLQELPKPLSLLTWDNAAQLGPATARALRVSDGDVIELSSDERRLRAAVMVTPGHAEGAITLTLGYGRTKAGRVGTKTSEQGGFNAFALRRSDDAWRRLGVSATRIGESYALATTQVHWSMPNPDAEAERRGLVRVIARDKFRETEHASRNLEHEHASDTRLTIYQHPEAMQRRIDGEGNRWGMVVNLTACIGCNACVVACQAENNVPVVGKDQVLRGREMHWLRIDRYYATTDKRTPEANPKTHFQPVACMHCENAPCEVVCPVGATTHSAEGLNEMTYNRCVGTRYCSNNCPYKVRRFNFFQYADHDTPSLKLLYNPDVTVRTRGVMEKCTYCVQRINGARIAAEMAGQARVAGNAVVTACQQACPTRAIVFGNMNDPAAKVVDAKRDPRGYGLLTELNTDPRTTYLEKLINPNPAIEA